MENKKNQFIRVFFEEGGSAEALGTRTVATFIVPHSISIKGLAAYTENLEGSALYIFLAERFQLHDMLDPKTGERIAAIQRYNAYSGLLISREHYQFGLHDDPAPGVPAVQSFFEINDGTEVVSTYQHYDRGEWIDTMALPIHLFKQKMKSLYAIFRKAIEGGYALRLAADLLKDVFRRAAAESETNSETPRELEEKDVKNEKGADKNPSPQRSLEP